MSEAAKSQIVEVAPAAAPAVSPPSEATAIIHMIERVARDTSIDIGRMERLMDMHERAMARQAKAAYASALAAMQAELPVIARKGRIEVRKKDAQGERTGALQQSTPYALWEDINEAIKPVLGKQGFALSFRTGMSQDGRITVTGILSHNAGHQEETTMTLPHDSTGSKNAVQAIGSSTAYGKRYTASALLNLTSRGEDDDGKAAGGPSKITDDQLDEVGRLITNVGADTARFCQAFSIATIADLPAASYDEAVRRLSAFGQARANKTTTPKAKS